MIKHAIALNIGSVLSRTFSIWAKNLVPFAILALIIESPVILYAMFGPVDTKLQARIYDSVHQYGSMPLSMIASAVIAYGVFQQLRGKQIPLGQCVAVGLRCLLPVIGVSLVVGLIVGVGTRLLVIPGLIAMCVFYVAIPAAVVEHLGVGAAIGRSASLTKGVRGAIFGLAFILGLVAGGVILAMIFLLPNLDLARAQRLELGAEGLDSVADFVRENIYRLRLRTALSQVAGAILGLLTSIASVIVYYDLRSQKEQIDIEQIAAVFD